MTMKNLVIVCAIVLAPALTNADKTFTGTKNATWDCAKEPNIHIMRGGGSYTFKGACKVIAIEGGDNKLVIEAVELLQIVGAGNTVDVGTLDTVNIVGAKNQVTWKKAKSGDLPKTSAIGADNKLGQAR
jgi:hypothetical protein